MPICYDVDIDIVREDGPDGSYETTLPRTIRSERPLTATQLAEQIQKEFNDFMELITGYDESRRRSYSRSGSWTVISIVDC